jgi:DNA uptake protein ComE-like DNA-binding protein
MSVVVSRSRSPQNVRVAARSRIFSARAKRPSSAPEDWVPSGLQASSPGASAAVRLVHEAEAVPADPPAAAELGAEVQRLRRDLGEAQKRADGERSRAEQAEREAAELRERVEAMKRAAARAATVAHPGEGEGSNGALDLNSASFEELRAVGLSVTQAARLIGQREQQGGFESVDDVDAVVGLPRDVKQTLKETGSV